MVWRTPLDKGGGSLSRCAATQRSTVSDPVGYFQTQSIKRAYKNIRGYKYNRHTPLFINLVKHQFIGEKCIKNLPIARAIAFS